MIKLVFLRNVLLVISLLAFTDSFSQKDSIQVNKILTKAYYFEDHNQPDSEIVYMKKAAALSKKIGFRRGISSSLAMLGVLYYDKGNFAKSIAYYYEGLRFDEKTGNEQGVMRNAGNLGIIYDGQGNHEKALWYFHKALKIAERLGMVQSASIQYSNIAITLSNQGKSKEALVYQLKALETDKLQGDETYITGDLINIGVSLNKLKRYDESLKYGFEALKMARQLEDPLLTADALNVLAEGYGDKGDFKLAENYFLECLEMGRKVNNPDLVRGYLEGISAFYEANGKHAQALKHYKEFIVLRDSVYSLNAAKESLRAELNYEFDRKKTATKFQYDKRVLKLNERNRLNMQLGIFLGVVLLLALVLLAFARRAFNTKKRLAEFLAAEDHRKEVLLQEVHHRINNNLQIISSLLSLQANAADDERLYEYLTQSQNRIQSLAVLHELMFDTNSPLEIDVKEYLSKILAFHRDVVETTNEGVTLETNIQPVQLPTKLAVPLALVMNELVTNAIKYAFKGRDKGKITVQFLPDGSAPDSWTMTVSDNGNGLPPEDEKRKDSLGLKLVSLMTRQIKGQMSVHSNGGAEFQLKFRLK